MKRSTLLFLALLTLPANLWAGSYDVLVVCDKSTAAAYATSAADPELANQAQLMAVRRVLRGWGANYREMPPSAVTTAMCASGLVYLNKTPNAYGYVESGPVDTFASVIHCGFNGSGASQFTGYRPDSMTRTSTQGPTVPQLILFDAQGQGQGDFNFNISATDSTGLVSGANFAGHHYEATYSATGRTGLFSSITQSTSGPVLKTNGSNGGHRPLLSYRTNTQALPDPDQIHTANLDSVVVYERMNLHKTGLARIVFAAVNGVAVTDSAAIKTYYRCDIEWPVLCFAIAHLDSLTGGRIIRRQRNFAFVIVGGGTTSARQHPGGLFQASDRADTTIHRASGDSVASTRAKITVAAAPESLGAAEAARWKRFGQVRFTPWVRAGLDSAVAGNTKATLSDPRDVWGRYRNRAFYGDSEAHAISATGDTSIYQLYKAARANLAATVGSAYLSRLIVAPESDWSPYQMRRNQNAALLDSVAWVAAKLGCSAVLCNTWGRDMDPTYLTNPKGYIVTQRPWTIQAASLRGHRMNFVGHSQFTVQGSQIHSGDDQTSFNGCPAADSCFGQGVWVEFPANYAPYAMWNSMYGPYNANSWNDGAGIAVTLAAAWSSQAFDNIIGTHQPASVMQLPAQAFGGQDPAVANRWGFYAIKAMMSAADAINYAAGRPVMVNSWAEEIVP